MGYFLKWINNNDKKQRLNLIRHGVMVSFVWKGYSWWFVGKKKRNTYNTTDKGILSEKKAMALFRLQTIIKKRINERSSNGAPIERNKEDNST